MKEGLILKYLDGTCSKKQAAKVQAWIAEDIAHSEEIRRLQAVWKELDGLKENKDLSVSDEWDSFAALLSDPSPEPINQPTSEPTLSASTAVEGKLKSETQSSPAFESTKSLEQKSQSAYVKPKPIQKKSSFWSDNLVYIIPAFLALCILAFWLWKVANKKNPIIEYTAGSDREYIELPDGSEVMLEPYAHLEYPRVMKGKKRRLSLISGAAEFDVVADTEPFIVQYDDVAVMALGTAFDIEKEDEYVVVECIDGDIRFFEIMDIKNGADLSKGQTFRYSNGIFEDVTPSEEIDEPEIQGTEITLGKLLDWLMETSGWKVTSKPSMPLADSHKVTVDLDQGYLNVMEQLKSQIYFEYSKASCNGCYVIKTMQVQ